MTAEKSQAIEKIALFFYFCFMDEGRAQTAAIKSIGALKSLSGNESNKAMLVRATKRILDKNKDFGSVSHLGFVQGHIEFPEGSNWGPWFEFRKMVDVDIFAAVIWVKVLQFPIPEVAQGLGVTQGTVRYRLSKGLRHLGQIIRGEVTL